MLDSRHAFQRSSLTDAQRLTYDVVEDYLEFTRLTDDYYYLDNSCRGSFTGFWAQLPILLNEFKFNRRSDLDSCFHIPETAEETFLGYAEIERERLENEAGLSQVTLDDIIAHEGYPGHIYQDTHIRALELPAIRYITTYHGYSEGRATYAKNFSARYAPVENEFAQLYQIGQQIGQMYISLLEIGVQCGGLRTGASFRLHSHTQMGTPA